MSTYTGVLDVTLQGFGFVCVSDDEDVPDIYIAKDDLNGALHGDVVEVEEKPEKWVKRRREGVIVGIVERKIKNIVGTLMKSKTGYFIIPDDERLGDSFDISEWDEKLYLFDSPLVGKKVVIKFDVDGNAFLDEVLGDEKQVGVDITSILRTYNLYAEFPKEVEDEAAAVAKKPSEKDVQGRLDLRKKTIITIDPSDAKDLDDAIHLEKRKDGMWELGVHIADVAHYVTENSQLDKEAYERGTSVYFPDRVIPMLPKALSNDVCSLNPDTDKLTLSVIMVIDPNGEVVSHKIHESIIKVHTRFAYSEVQALLDGTHNTLLTSHLKKKFLPLFQDMAKLTLLVEKKRRARGEVVFDVPEPRIILDESTGKIKDVIAYPHYLSHRIIETFMILCNEVVAEYMHKLEMPFIFRTHEKPAPEKVGRFVEMLKPFAVQHMITPDNPTGHKYQAMLDKLDKDLKPIISQLALRSMAKAKYTEYNLGHFGLGSKFYCHFTSPIRRYPDLVIHRIIKMMINRRISSHKREQLFDFCQRASVQSTKMEIHATEAEREVDNLKRAEYMSDKIGETFLGTISGIREFGVFVYVPSNTCEGLIRIENMPQDNYTFNERQMTLVGRKKTFKMGDKIEVVVAAVNMTRRQVEFRVDN